MSAETEYAKAGMQACTVIIDTVLATRLDLLHQGWPADNKFLQMLDNVAQQMADGHRGFKKILIEEIYNQETTH